MLWQLHCTPPPCLKTASTRMNPLVRLRWFFSCRHDYIAPAPERGLSCCHQHFLVIWDVWTGRRNIRLWQAATCNCSCFHSSEIIQCEARIGCSESSRSTGPEAGSLLPSDLQLGPPRSFEHFPRSHLAVSWSHRCMSEKFSS